MHRAPHARPRHTSLRDHHQLSLGEAPLTIEKGCHGVRAWARKNVCKNFGRATTVPATRREQRMTSLQNRPNTALVVIDVQNDVVSGAHERDGVIANINTLVDK